MATNNIKPYSGVQVFGFFMALGLAVVGAVDIGSAIHTSVEQRITTLARSQAYEVVAESNRDRELQALGSKQCKSGGYSYNTSSYRVTCEGDNAYVLSAGDKIALTRPNAR